MTRRGDRLVVLRCPFCGDKGAAPIPFYDEMDIPWRVVCGAPRGTCGARGGAAWSAEGSVKRWNSAVKPFWDMLKEKSKAEVKARMKARKKK